MICLGMPHPIKHTGLTVVASWPCLDDLNITRTILHSKGDTAVDVSLCIEQRMAGHTYPLHVVPKSKPTISRARSSTTVIFDIRRSKFVFLGFTIVQI